MDCGGSIEDVPILSDIPFFSHFIWKSSMRLPEGSSIQICDPPGPLTTSSRRNFTPAARSRATSALMSDTSNRIRFHPPGTGFVLSGGGRRPELCSPLNKRRKFPRTTEQTPATHLSLEKSPDDW